MLPRPCNRDVKALLQRLLRYGVLSDGLCWTEAQVEAERSPWNSQTDFLTREPTLPELGVAGPSSIHQGTGRCCAAALPVSHSAVRATSPGYRALARCFSSAGGVEAADDVVLMTEAAVKRLHELVGTSASPGETCLRLTVEAGGCSGFSYQFALDGGPTEDDRMFEKSGARLIIDSVSYQLVRGATVDFADELIKSTFEVVANPNAGGSCGCGSSFALKDI